MSQLAFEDSGRGSPVVLFVHAFPFDRRMWRRQIDALARHDVRTIAVDLAGFGASADLPPRRSVDEHADDVAQVLEACGVDRAIAVGLSMGGYVALALARRHPQRLAGLVLADTRASGDTEEAKQGRAVNIERARKQGVAAVFDAMSTAWPPNADRMHIEEMRSLSAAQNPAGVIAALEMMRDRPDATPTLGQIRVPTRVIVGSADGLTPPSLAEIMTRSIPGAQQVIIEGAGHFTNIERSAEFDQVLLDLVRHVRPT
ncbi:MAG: alpha/beta fold hydrolase [Deltaproteobacteria bacterium]|nr:alpha/beta fold hydrolase [Deltaproteobacteria bacterium]